MSDPIITLGGAVAPEPEPGEPGHPDTPMPAPSLGWTMGLVSDPFDYSRDDEVGLPANPIQRPEGTQ